MHVQTYFPYKRVILTVNKTVINYLPRCTYHLLYPVKKSRQKCSNLACCVVDLRPKKQNYVYAQIFQQSMFMRIHYKSKLDQTNNESAFCNLDCVWGVSIIFYAHRNYLCNYFYLIQNSNYPTRHQRCCLLNCLLGQIYSIPVIRVARSFR